MYLQIDVKILQQYKQIKLQLKEALKATFESLGATVCPFHFICELPGATSDSASSEEFVYMSKYSV